MLIFWFATMIFAVTVLKLVGVQILYYFASTIVTMIVFDLLKILFSLQNKKADHTLDHDTPVQDHRCDPDGFGIFVIIRASWS